MWNPFKKKTSIQQVNVLEELLKEAGLSPSKANKERLSTVFACCRVISESIGMLPMSLYQKDDKGRKRLSDDLAYLLSVQPNEWQTAQEFWEMVGLHLAMRGNFYAFKNVVGGRVKELLPITGSVKKKLSENYEVLFEVTINGKMTPVPQENILHIPLMTLDGITGINPLEYNRSLFGYAVEEDNLATSFIKNPSRPGGVLSTPQNLTQDQVDEARKKWDERYGGKDNFRTAIMGNDFKYYPTSMSAADLQFMESRKMTRSEICGIFRVPAHKVGDLENATFSNIEHQGQEFVTDCLMPYLTRIEARVRKDVIPESKRNTQYVKFNVAALVRGDMAARGQFYTQLVQNGALSPNEIRELEDRPPRDGGDIYLTPMNMLVNGENLTKPNS